jgi:hypothetical protein
MQRIQTGINRYANDSTHAGFESLPASNQQTRKSKMDTAFILYFESDDSKENFCFACAAKRVKAGEKVRLTGEYDCDRTLLPTCGDCGKSMDDVIGF